jgi:hypothetical protein
VSREPLPQTDAQSESCVISEDHTAQLLLMHECYAGWGSIVVIDQNTGI